MIVSAGPSSSSFCYSRWQYGWDGGRKKEEELLLLLGGFCPGGREVVFTHLAGTEKKRKEKEKRGMSTHRSLPPKASLFSSRRPVVTVRKRDFYAAERSTHLSLFVRRGGFARAEVAGKQKEK